MKKILFYFLLGVSFILQSCINDNEDPVYIAPSDGEVVNPNVGGAAQPNQVWFDFGTNTQTVTKRTDWDFAFYTGNEFKVVLNSSIMMAATKISGATDIDQVTEADVTSLKKLVQVSNFNPSNVIYIDAVNGNFPQDKTVIEDIKASDSENGIYLVNMGKEIYTGTVANGSINTGEDSRGWMKVQIVRSGQGYKMLYAEVGDTKHQEIIVTKDAKYNFTFINLKKRTEVKVQPEKKKWDICFSVFTNVIPQAGSYIYADFVSANIMGGVGIYEIVVPASGSGTEAYHNFKISDIDQHKFIYDNQRVIGASWRSTAGGLNVFGDRFYIIKDADGYYFKMIFTRLTSINGERGRPQFEYKPLN